MKIGDRFELTLETLALGGEALARIDGGMVVFVQNGIPGDRAFVEITKRKQRFAVGQIVELLEPSALRITPRCEYFGRCGGCKWQQLAYADQITFKRRQVVETLAHLGRVQAVTVNEMLCMDDPWYYRNKMEFSFSRDDQQGLILGQHYAGRWDQLIDLRTCYLQSPQSVEIFDMIREFARKQELTVFSTETGQGLLRHAVIREGKHTGEIMLNLVTSSEYVPQLDRFVRFLLTGCPQITSIVLTINTRLGESTQGQAEHLIFGKPTITETVNSLTFDISAQSFFQTNTLQAEKLYQTVLRMAQVNSQGVAVDLYCGTGAIALHLAALFERVYGIEIVADAVQNAIRNAERNRIANVTFQCGEVLKTFPGDLPAQPDLIVLDPPRAGLSPKVVRRVREAAPAQIIYVSCNPATLSRDIALFTDGGYAITEVQPIDMFPHTYHIETVVDLRRRT